ncbi:MAG: hypothetical protein Q8N20_04155, partial [Eubacteriales bacterium]|nr:hypothetical protein [Eubacteriales bacterium]
GLQNRYSAVQFRPPPPYENGEGKASEIGRPYLFLLLPCLTLVVKVPKPRYRTAGDASSQYFLTELPVSCQVYIISLHVG